MMSIIPGDMLEAVIAVGLMRRLLRFHGVALAVLLAVDPALAEGAAAGPNPERQRLEPVASTGPLYARMAVGVSARSFEVARRLPGFNDGLAEPDPDWSDGFLGVGLELSLAAGVALGWGVDLGGFVGVGTGKLRLDTPDGALSAPRKIYVSSVFFGPHLAYHVGAIVPELRGLFVELIPGVGWLGCSRHECQKAKMSLGAAVGLGYEWMLSGSAHVGAGLRYTLLNRRNGTGDWGDVWHEEVDYSLSSIALLVSVALL